MAKTRQKEHKSELDHLRKQNRQLIKENNALRRQLKYHEKREHIYDGTDIEDKVEITPPDVINITKCPECHKGNLTYQDYKFVELYTCSDCDYKKRVKK